MSKEPRTTYTPENEEFSRRREEEKRVAEEGSRLWKKRKEELQRQEQLEKCELRRMLSNYSPWGRPGGGAPCASTLRKKNVPLEPRDTSRPRHQHQQYQQQPQQQNRRRLIRDVSQPWLPLQKKGPSCTRKKYNPSKNLYYTCQGHCILRDDSYTQEKMKTYKGSQTHRYNGEKEYFSSLENYRHLRDVSMSDSNSNGAVNPWCATNIGNREYIKELTQQIRQKKENAMKEKRFEVESCHRHFDTWKNIWGRPGHGAPMQHVQRNNLLRILYYPCAVAY